MRLRFACQTVVASLLLSACFFRNECHESDPGCSPLIVGLSYILNPCTIVYDELTNPNRWSAYLQPELLLQSSLGQSGGQQAVSFGSAAPGGGAYYGGVLAPNGRIYLVPISATSYRFIDPAADSVQAFGPPTPGGFAFQGGVLASGGGRSILYRGARLNTITSIHRPTRSKPLVQRRLVEMHMQAGFWRQMARSTWRHPTLQTIGTSIPERKAFMCVVRLRPVAAHILEAFLRPTVGFI